MGQIAQPQMEAGYTVEWVADVPLDQFGEADIDRADLRYEDFATLDEAKARAKQVLILDWFGEVKIRDFSFVRYDDGGYPVFSREYGSHFEIYE